MTHGFRQPHFQFENCSSNAAAGDRLRKSLRPHEKLCKLRRRTHGSIHYVVVVANALKIRYT